MQFTTNGQDLQNFLIEKGWHQYYNPNYWVHPDSVEDPKSQDYTDYGMNLEDALYYESIGKPKHPSMGLPVLSKLVIAQEYFQGQKVGESN